jgi:hypothetical protein
MLTAKIVTIPVPFRADVLEIGEVCVRVDGEKRYIWSYFQNGRQLDKSGIAQDFDGRISNVKVTRELSLQGLFQMASLVPFLKADIEELEEAARG